MPATSKTKGDRHNNGKVALSHILQFGDALRGVSMVASLGEMKYARLNYQKGLDEAELVDSLMRHLQDGFNANSGVVGADGKALDGETNLHAYYHVAWNALVLAMQHAGELPDVDEWKQIQAEFKRLIARKK